MALLINGNYAVVDMVTSDKRRKEFQFDLFSYTDSTRTVLVSSTNFQRLKGSTPIVLAGHLPEGATAGMSVNPPDPEAPPLANGIYLSFELMPFQVITGVISFYCAGEGQVFIDNNHRYVCAANVCTMDDTVWIETDFSLFFCLSELNKLNSNPIKAAYLFLKSLPEFAGATDV